MHNARLQVVNTLGRLQIITEISQKTTSCMLIHPPGLGLNNEEEYFLHIVFAMLNVCSCGMGGTRVRYRLCFPFRIGRGVGCGKETAYSSTRSTFRRRTSVRLVRSLSSGCPALFFRCPDQRLWRSRRYKNGRYTFDGKSPCRGLLRWRRGGQCPKWYCRFG